MQTKPKSAAFEIATAGQGRESRTGMVLGAFAVHKEPRAYFWTLTHTPTGMSINIYPPLENKAEALAKLVEVANGGGLKDYHRDSIAKAAGQWGAGL